LVLPRYSSDGTPHSPRFLKRGSPRKKDTNSPRAAENDVIFIRSLSEGGSGCKLYIAKNKEGFKFCVKRLPITNSTQVDEFKKEVDILRNLQCPYIVQFIGFRQTLTYLELRMSLYDGDLGFYIRSAKKPFTVKEITDYIQQIAKALYVLHNRLITHRDIKPANIFYDLLEGGDIGLKVGDMGEAKLISPRKKAISCRGTPLYNAPEMLRTQEYDRKVDIWSLGMVAYELMTQVPPYEECKGLEFITKILDEQQMPELTQDQSDMYSKILPIWKNMLSYDPEDRPEANQLIIALDYFK